MSPGAQAQRSTTPIARHGAESRAGHCYSPNAPSEMRRTSLTPKPCPEEYIVPKYAASRAFRYTLAVEVRAGGVSSGGQPQDSLKGGLS